MNKIRVISLTTFRELVRERFFLVLLFAAIFLIALSLLLGELSFDESQKILADIGLMAIQICSLGLALFTGSYMLSREIEKQTCLLMLSRPITRAEFFLGKFSGIVILITVINFFLSLGLLGLLNKWEWSLHMFQVVLSIWLEALVVLSFVFLFSVILRPVLSVMIGVMVFLVGHWLEDMTYFAQKTKDEGLMMLSTVLKWCFPNFYRFNWKTYFFLEKGASAQDMMALAMHYVPWIVLLLVLAVSLFRRKDIV